MNNHTDGFFNVSPENGFLPIREPLEKLPEKYKNIQNVIDSLPTEIKNQDPKTLELLINRLPNYYKMVNEETDVFLIQALFRAYTFMTSAYLLFPAHQSSNIEGEGYGKANTILPPNLAMPLDVVAKKLDVYPWLDYHYAYSLGNYIRKDPENSSLHWDNLKMACSFTGEKNENGFIMNHVYINEVSPDLIKSIHMFYNNDHIYNHKQEQEHTDALKLFNDTLVEMNNRRKTMWEASNHKNYNDFRVFIMGIEGNDDIFSPDGVLYQYMDKSDISKSNELSSYRTYRGQTGAQDSIIPTSDIFTGIVDYYPENKLTEYLMNLRTYRPKCMQDFFENLNNCTQTKSVKQTLIDSNNVDGLIYLLSVIEQVYFFRNGHWQFVQKYIMANTKYQIATGGTPIISWIPNQIEACLKAISDLASIISRMVTGFEPNFELFSEIIIKYPKKVLLLHKQLDELKKVDYNVETIYNLNSELELED